MVPLRAVEVRELQQIGNHSSKPIIERHMELWSDVASLKIEDQRNCTGVLIADSDIDAVL
jgi:hypothetical protein